MSYCIILNIITNISLSVFKKFFSSIFYNNLILIYPYSVWHTQLTSILLDSIRFPIIYSCLVTM